MKTYLSCAKKFITRRKITFQVLTLSIISTKALVGILQRRSRKSIVQIEVAETVHKIIINRKKQAFPSDT